MVSYKILWKKSAVKELKRITPNIIPKIILAVESLSKNPYPAGVRKLHGSNYTYRIRIGEYRAIYTIFQNRLVIEIIRVGHRKDAYKKT
ncbi:MAG: type II toxin-antitoxin system RelE/ParE family toxin [bacterium]